MQEAVPAGVGGMSAVLGMTADEINAAVDEIPKCRSQTTTARSDRDLRSLVRRWRPRR